MKLSAIIPATDQPPMLAVCEKAIADSKEPPDEVVVIREPSFGGPAQGRNLGAQQATGDVLVFVDADVEVHPDAFSLIRASFEGDPELAAVFGSYDDDPERNGLVSDFRNLLHHHVHQEGAGEAVTFWAGLGAVRREAFLAVGGFDEQRFPRASIEDIEFGMRLSRNGGRIILDPRIQGKHLKRWTISKMVRTDLLDRGIPWMRLLLDTGSTSTALNLGWRHRASAAASVIGTAALVGRRPRIAYPAILALVALNMPFYRFLLERRGPKQALAGIPLHTLHHLLGSMAVPTAVVLHFHGRFRLGKPPPWAPASSREAVRRGTGAVPPKRDHRL